MIIGLFNNEVARRYLHKRAGEYCTEKDIPRYRWTLSEDFALWVSERDQITLLSRQLDGIGSLVFLDVPDEHATMFLLKNY